MGLCVSEFLVGLGFLLRQGLSGLGFYGGLVCWLRRIVGSNNFSAQFIRVVSHCRGIGYNINNV